MAAPQAPPSAAARWLDSPDRYGLVSRALHWGMAALFAWQFTGMVLRLLLGRTPVTAVMVGSHAPVGTLLLGLVLLRFLWAWGNRHRRPRHERTPAGRAAWLGHAVLYVLMVVIPLLALLRQYGSGRAFVPFGVPLMEASDKIPWLMAPADAVHGWLAWLLLALIVGHVIMVLVHQYVWRDDIATRMLPARRTKRLGG
ncbi:MAG: cytochrome b [Pigmentiphaga sp.]